MGGQEGMKVDGLNIGAWSKNDESGRFKRILLQYYGNLPFRVRVTCKLKLG